MQLGSGMGVVIWVVALAVALITTNFEGVKSHGVQPLSRINILETVMALHEEAYIKASPSVLGVTVGFTFMGLLIFLWFQI